MKSILSVQNLTYKEIFSNLTIDFKSNKLNIISGPNSSGKTTLLKLLGKQLPTNKSIFYNNKLLEEYSSSKLYNLFQLILSDEDYYFNYPTLEQLINNLIYSKDNNNVVDLSKRLLSILRLNKHLKDNPNQLDISTKLKIRLVISLIIKPKYLLIDNLTAYLTTEEKDTILTLLKELSTEITIILTTNNLDDSLYADNLYIIKQTLQLTGKPLEVLIQDNTLNKLGLSIPYMIDLSVKLKDYDLIKEIELDWEKLVNELWK